MAPRLVAFAVLLASASALTLRQEKANIGTDIGIDLSKAASEQASIARLLAESDALSLELQRAAQDPSIGQDTADLLRSFRQCAKCKEHRRYGEHGDGGYVMCNDQLKNTKLSAAYSYGVSGYDGWGNDISKAFGIPVHEYDCTNNNAPAACATCELHFHNECLKAHVGQCSMEGPNGGWHGPAVCRTLGEHLTDNGHNALPEGSLILKVDVEAAEWNFFASEPAETLKKAQQLLVEFHWLKDTSQHALYKQAMQRILDAGFAVEHLHGNNYAGTASFGQYSIPEVLEVTFVRKSLSEGLATCEKDMVRLPEDEANWRGHPELYEGHLADK